MSRNLVVKLFLVVLFVLTFSACGADDEEDRSGFFCPPCNATVNLFGSSYGGAVTGNFGNDDYGWKLESDCGWIIYNGHQGGGGDTLELSSCNEGVVFVWAWQAFSHFTLEEGWTGQTNRGIRIGSTLEEFRGAYPEFYFDWEYGNTTCYKYDNPLVFAWFEDGALIHLFVG